jgi:hypothetical protein
MKNNAGVKKILEHIDREEIISKLIIGISPSDIHDWLSAKYTSPAEKKFVISLSTLKTFKDNHLDVYQMIKDDIQKTKQLSSLEQDAELELAVKDNPTYKSKMMELASKEIDVRKIIAQLATAIEIRFGQYFDEIQLDPRNLNTRTDRVLIEFAETLGNLLEKYFKFTEAPQNIGVQNNVSIQIVDSQVMIIHEAIRETLSELDLESSFLFMDRLNEKMTKLKLPNPDNAPNTDAKLAEVKILNETINQKLNF